VTNTPSRPAARSSIDGLTEDEQVPKGYVILTEAIRDRAGIDACGAASMTSLLEHGTRVLVADENVEVLEGEWHGNRTVVVEYESVGEGARVVRVGELPRRAAHPTSSGRLQRGDRIRFRAALTRAGMTHGQRRSVARPRTGEGTVQRWRWSQRARCRCRVGTGHRGDAAGRRRPVSRAAVCATRSSPFGRVTARKRR